MNPNDETRDEALLRQVEQRLADRSSGGNTLLDALAGTMPQAQPQFQQSLEEKLVAQIAQKNGSKNIMLGTEKRKRTPTRRMLRWLAAAMILFVIGGTFISFRLAMTPMNAAPQAIEPQIGCWAQPANVTFYQVQQGDTLASIALQYGVRYEDLLTVNCLLDNQQPVLAPGMLLNIPKVGTVSPEIHLPTIAAVPTIPPFEFSAPTVPPQGVFRVWVAHEKIRQGTMIKPEMVMDIFIPIENAVYQGQYAMPALLYDKVALIDIEPNVPILRSFVGDTPTNLLPNSETVQVVVAKNAISMGTTITANLVEPRMIPIETAFYQGLYAELDAIIGKVAQDNIAALEPILAYQVQQTRPAEEVTGLLSIVIAVEDIPYGTALTEDMLTVAYYPEKILDALEETGYYFSTIEELIGRSAAETIPAWHPIQMKATTNQSFDGVNSILPPGTVAVSLPMNTTEMADYDLRVGDRIDVIAALMFVDIDAATQMPDSLATAVAAGDAQVMLQRTIQNALIVYIGDFPAEGSSVVVSDDTSADIITLAVSPQDAAVLMWLIEAKVPLTFALRHD